MGLHPNFVHDNPHAHHVDDDYADYEEHADRDDRNLHPLTLGGSGCTRSRDVSSRCQTLITLDPPSPPRTHICILFIIDHIELDLGRSSVDLLGSGKLAPEPNCPPEPITLQREPLDPLGQLFSPKISQFFKSGFDYGNLYFDNDNGGKSFLDGFGYL